MTRKDNLSLGFTLLEVCVALALLSLVALVLVHALTVRVASGDLSERKKAASQAAENGVEALAALSRTVLPDGPGFEWAGDNTITPTTCTPLTCDFVLDPVPPDSERTSLARGVPWQAGFTPPNGYQVAFLRRWRVQTVDAELHLREISVAVLRNEQAEFPLALQTTQAEIR